MEFCVSDITTAAPQPFPPESAIGQRLALSQRGMHERLCAYRLAETMLRRCCPDCAVNFAFAPNGKPYASGHPLHFNLSHSGRYVAAAVDKKPIGIDIECPRPFSERLAARVCSPDELKWLDGDALRFAQLWTVKEALLKYRGTGIFSGDLRTLSVLRGDTLFIDGLRLHTECNADYALSVVYEST